MKTNHITPISNYYRESHSDFKKCFWPSQYDQPPFYGDDAKLYQLLQPTRCRREDFSDFSDAGYYSLCSVYMSGYIRGVMSSYLKAEAPHPDNIAPLCLPEWLDAFVPAWNEIGRTKNNFRSELKQLNLFMEKVHKVHKYHKNYQPEQVEFASKVLSGLKALTIEGELKDQVIEIIG